MPTVNRYTQITPSKFDPLSMEEILAVPMYKQKKYDELEAANAAMRTLPVDPLRWHEDEAKQLKDNFESKIENQALQLAKTGDIQGGKENFLRLKREYEDLISPTGRAGQITNAKKVYQERFKEYVEDATKTKGYSREDALRNWYSKHESKYSGYDDENNVTQIGEYGAPKRLVLQEDLKAVKSMLDEDAKSYMASNGLHFQQGPEGGFIMVNGEGRMLHTTNNRQINNALEYLQSRWLTGSGEGRISAEFEGMDPQRLVDEINNGVGMMRKDKWDDTRKLNYAYHAKPKGDDVTADGGVIISNDSKISSDATDVKTFEDVKTTLSTLEGKGKDMTSAERAKLEDLRELKAEAEVRMLKDPAYVAALKEFNNAKARLNKNDYPTTGRAAEGEYAIRKAGLNKAESKLKGIQDDYWKKSSSLRHNYSYMPSNPKEESIWNLHNENVYNVMKAIPKLGSLLDLTSIHTTGGTKKNVTVDDVDNIQELIKTADPKTFKINNIKTYGDNKTPEITMTFNTLEDAEEYDMADETSLDDEYGGSKKPVTVTFRLKRFSNAPDTGSAPGFKSLAGAIGGFWKDKGGINEVTGNFQGAEVYNSLIENTYRDISDEDLYARAAKDSDAKEAFLIRVAKYKAAKAKK